ncbi:glycerophosphodiester phosphodiesterase [Desulfoluna spongiiphila]|uniref:glycerophosphodiester phosphodiesterase n=1 Tax=Desulfoluna spongiiphila TaxID=419481 RepID=UPI0012588429|nr:glycerophosphodiester phosphodiesterase [Desulfoluna spongiiphila]VVS90718.1 prokaryotic membrane lipoprotein lipid attachment site profile [Desulfoluna spongiiphila]
MKVKHALFVGLMVLVSLGVMGCDSDLTSENTVIVVSDGVTGGPDGAGEVLPNVMVYKVANAAEASFTDLVFAEKVEGAHVGFAVRAFGETAWVPLMEEAILTDGDGRARLSSLKERLPASYLDAAPVTLQLQGRVYFSETEYASDDLGIIRVLSEDAELNPGMIAADHDNTIHATGGLNALQDWVDFLNVFQGDWPYVDDEVETVIPRLMEEGNDLIIVTGMFPELRYGCRAQMMSHFETGAHRTIPIIVKDDMLFEHSNTFKDECLKILKDLYGGDNARGMVGDTVRQDGYGAVANGILYVPFQIHYEPDFWLLDTEGYGWIHPDTIAWDWGEVEEKIAEGPVVPANYFLKHHTGFKNIAHRGGGELAPENTLVAYRNSLAEGADTLEGDVHMTSDGVVVVSHDETVDRCTDGTGAITGMTLAQVKALDAGYRFTTDDGATYPWRGKGLTLPTLEEVFTDGELGGAPMVLEIKQEGSLIVDKVLDLIEANAMQDKLILGGFDQSTLDLIKAKAGERGLSIKTIFATEGVLEFTLTPTAIMKKEDYEMPADVLCLPAAMMTQILMAKIRILGMKCYVWTVNTEIEMKRQMDWLKVDGIMTDNPKRLNALVEP